MNWISSCENGSARVSVSQCNYENNVSSISLQDFPFSFYKNNLQHLQKVMLAKEIILCLVHLFVFCLVFFFQFFFIPQLNFSLSPDVGASFITGALMQSRSDPTSTRIESFIHVTLTISIQTASPPQGWHLQTSVYICRVPMYMLPPLYHNHYCQYGRRNLRYCGILLFVDGHIYHPNGNHTTSLFIELDIQTFEETVLVFCIFFKPHIFKSKVPL